MVTNAATGASNVVGLVYVAAFAPDEGETLLEVAGGFQGQRARLRRWCRRQYPTRRRHRDRVLDRSREGPWTRSQATSPSAEPTLIAVIQRPISELAFSEASGPPAWKTLPSWAVVATGDRAAGTDVVRAHAERAGAEITEVDGSHVIMISQPQAVTDVIEAAIAKVG